MRNSEKLRTNAAKLLADCRQLAEERAQPDGTLSAEDQATYDRMWADYTRTRDSAIREENIEKEEAEARSAEPEGGEPVRPEPRNDGQPAQRQSPYGTPEYRSGFQRYLRTGIARGLSVVDVDDPAARALQVDSDTAGGYVVAAEQFVNQLIQKVDDAVVIRGLANVIQVPSAQSLGVPTLETDPDDADWTHELGTGSEDSAMAFGKRELRPHPLAKRIKVSNRLLRSALIDVEDLVAARLAYKIAIPQEKAFLTGNGNQRPLGVFTASTDGISTGRDVTASSSTAFSADDLQDTKFSLKPQYRRAARWLFHRDALKRTAKLKDGNGQYLLQPGISADIPDRVLGLPFLESEYAPNTFTTGLYVALLGDFSFYWIADALDTQIQRLTELYAETNQTGFISRSESDGMPVLEEAFARLKLA